MKTLRTLAAAGALVAGLALSASANAATLVSIGLSTGGPATTVATGTSSANITDLNFGDWTLNSVNGHLGFAPDILNSNSFNANAISAGFLDVFVTAQGLTGPVPGFLSGFTENLLTAGWSVVETTYLSTSNALYGGAVLSSKTFNTVGSGTAVSGATVAPGVTYSVTEQFHIVSNGIGNAQSTLDITAVPEPATWGMMILGFGGIGAMVRNSRRRQAVATA